MKLLFQLFFIVAAISLVSFYYFSSQLEKRANKMLDHAVVSQSINEHYYVGFIEDCSGHTISVESSHCFRKIYYYKGKSKRGICELPGGTIPTAMFENLKLTWKGVTQVTWQSTFGTVDLALNDLNCKDFSSIVDRFELIPTYEATAEKWEQQKLEALIEKNKLLMERAKRQINTNQ